MSTVRYSARRADRSLRAYVGAELDGLRATRRALLTDACGAGALVLGSHFPTRPGGRLAPEGDGWRFLRLAAEV